MTALEWGNTYNEGKQAIFKFPHVWWWHIHPPDRLSSKSYSWIIFFLMCTILNQQTNPSQSSPCFTDLLILFISTALPHFLIHVWIPATIPWLVLPGVSLHPTHGWQRASWNTSFNLLFQKTDLWTQMQSFLVNGSFLWIQNHPCLIPQRSPSLSWNEIQSAWCSWLVNSHICAFFLCNSTFSTFCQYVFIFLQNSSPARLSWLLLCQLLHSTSPVCVYKYAYAHTYYYSHVTLWFLSSWFTQVSIKLKIIFVNVFINGFIQ